GPGGRADRGRTPDLHLHHAGPSVRNGSPPAPAPCPHAGGNQSARRLHRQDEGALVGKARSHLLGTRGSGGAVDERGGRGLTPSKAVRELSMDIRVSGHQIDTGDALRTTVIERLD